MGKQNDDSLLFTKLSHEKKLNIVKYSCPENNIY